MNGARGRDIASAVPGSGLPNTVRGNEDAKHPRIEVAAFHTVSPGFGARTSRNPIRPARWYIPAAAGFGPS
jgi:hypothetical protein